MSKNIRDYIGAETGKTITVEQLPPIFDEENGLSYIELELNQVLPKLTVKTKVEEYKVLEALRAK